ncbi:uncharacterized protein LOC121732012 [Aricia agestis]|uniref:uncharacterized protein LOC121732012 n=1 Tax=Aricia agestis TaxID=91739 RepID=UPI001C20B35B|nr:uncharacterized protein LOC121732012 [Aricia agestis]
MDDDCKDYRKNKPQQKLYKPGSGPLRRSRYGLDSKMDYNFDNSQKYKDKSYYGSQQSINGEDSLCESREKAIPRHRKPEQQLYVPKSGESSSEVDRSSNSSMRCNNSSQYNNRQISSTQDNSSVANTGSHKSASGREFSKRDGVANDFNSNRHYRQGSETRSVSPGHFNQDYNSLDRNRDSRSMEPWAGRNKQGSGGKPPSGRRNSAGYQPVNLDNIPPRFRKKYLEKAGHQSFDNVDQLHHDHQTANEFIQSGYHSGQFYNSNTNWSQTLPSRGRGRLKDNDNFDREKFMNSYLKSYEAQNSRKSTPSNSYLNLYESTVLENKSNKPSNSQEKANVSVHDNKQNSHDNVTNGTSSSNNVSEEKDKNYQDNEKFNECETASHNSTNLSDLTNLDWTEEVEKNIKLDDLCNTEISFSNVTPKEEVKIEPRESKRSTRSRHKDRRSSSRGHKNSEKKERNRRDSNVSVHETERTRKDSNVSVQYESMPSNLKHRERERRDSHRSNKSSTIGNSRDDLDRWRSLRSFSREHSTERRIVSQCNSRDPSMNRATSPRDHDGFRVPTGSTKSSMWSSKKNDYGGRGSSSERRQLSPAASVVSVSETGDAPSGGRRREKRRRRGRNAENVQPPTRQPPGAHPAPAHNWREEILESKKHERHPESTHQRNRLNSVLSEKSVSEPTTQPGLIILPQSSKTHLQKDQRATENQKTLYDYNNPSKPIIVQTSPSKQDTRMERSRKESTGRGGGSGYDANDAARAARHTALLQKVDRADAILKMHILRGPAALANTWSDVAETRKFLQSALEILLLSDLKFCQSDNIEQQFWKILYYHFIETLRKSIPQATPEEKAITVKLINTIIEEGTIFFENLVQLLEKTYKFNTDDFINDNHVLPPKGLGYVGLALISVQKLYVFLGDLSRYKEQVNETNNYGKSKHWYTKAQQINPKNGRPYNQLAILAIYARRKLDAVYYYMRSLMSSNPFQSARESLLSLFDENRKKYETAERKRRTAAESREAGGAGGASGAGTRGAGGVRGAGLRREVWVRPGGGRTATLTHAPRDDYLDTMTPVELNKNFIMSYLHVNGKLITKIGMESFHEAAGSMVRQFRALLHRSPLPTPAPRLLQLTALNMFAVETTAAATRDNGSGERSAWLECALGVSLLMFGALLERCCALLPEPPHTQQFADALLLLPAIKVWSDWMLCHSSIWNPPPSFDNFEVETDGDPWDWLAKLMNILESLDDKSIELETEQKEGCTCVRLPEDASLGGFTPLMYMEPAGAWARPGVPHHAAEHALRLRKLLFFGTEYLVGVDPPVLKLEYPSDAQPRYVSAVQRTQPAYPPLTQLSEDSEDEDTASGATSGPTSLCDELPEGADETTKKLLKRKEQLESRNATLERRRKKMQEMLGSDWVSVEVEVRPRWLVPDTNCFIDHLPLLRAVLALPDQPYQLAVPLVVVSELEGLQKCSRVGPCARAALDWLNSGGGGVRFATTRGSLLASCAFTAERDAAACNDDRVLATALALHANLTPHHGPRGTEEAGAGGAAGGAEGGAGGGARRARELVLVSDDRNLRVKALAADLPTRDLPSFAHWAGIDTDKSSSTKAPTAPGDSPGNK